MTHNKSKDIEHQHDNANGTENKLKTKQANNVKKNPKKKKEKEKNKVGLRGFKLLTNKGFLSASSPHNVQQPP